MLLVHLSDDRGFTVQCVGPEGDDRRWLVRIGAWGAIWRNGDQSNLLVRGASSRAAVRRALGALLVTYDDDPYWTRETRQPEEEGGVV